jgi:hypothetical protein
MDFVRGSRYIDDKAGVDKREGEFFLPGGPAASFDWRSTAIKIIIAVKSTGYIMGAAAAQANYEKWSRNRKFLARPIMRYSATAGGVVPSSGNNLILLIILCYHASARPGAAS